MQLKTLAGAIPVRQVIGPLDRAVESIAYDSRRVQRNGLFVALRGEKNDGHEFIGQAIENGASVIVAEREEKNPRATCLLVENTRTALADLAATFYGLPARRLKLAAVTQLTQDQLDYHGTMENYFESKAKLFTQLTQQQKKRKPVAVVNMDDRYGEQLLDKIDTKISVVTFGMGVRADFRASNYRME